MTNRDRLVLAAGDLFYRNGYAATSVEDILETTGVARSNFYYHFDGKLDLAREVLRRWVDEFETDIRRPAEPGQDALERISGIFRRVRAGWWDEDAEANGDTLDESDHLPCPMGALALELAPHDPEVRTVAAEFHAALNDSLRIVIADGTRRGELNPDVDPEPAAMVALAALHGALLLCQTQGATQPMRRAETALLDLLAPRRPQP